MGDNVTIPLPILKSLVVLLEYWDVSLLDRTVQDDYWDALWALKIKLLKLDLRDAYAMIVNARDDEARHMARIEYLRLKRELETVADGSYTTL